ncbi:roadblock/LC7 domain-containing protein [Streptomyces noboritoensis]|uniref:Roadblock/LC7 domain-containing protein n=1 Tax=Streptomyces noboritoensis TaxID=67337 RepID=A0ABV6TCJ0_9ACTN
MQEPKMQTAAPGGVGWLLSGLEAPGVRFSVVVAADGLVIGHSDGIDRDRADQVASAVSGVWALGKALAGMLDGGPNAVRQHLLETDAGFMLVTAAGENGHFAVGTTADADISVVAHRMNELAVKVGQALSSKARGQAAQGDVRL